MQPFTKTIKAGKTLFQEKDHSRELYIVQDGSVLIYRKIGGKELVLARLEKGSVFGEMALIDGKPRSASAKALTDCSLILIDADTFLDKIKGVPPWFMSIIRTTSEKIRKANQRLQTTASAENLEAKVILVISHFFKRYGESDERRGGRCVELEQIKKQIIQLLCLSHQRLMRVLDMLEKTGLITIRADYICLPDVSALDDCCVFLRNQMRKVYDHHPDAMSEFEAFIGAVLEKTPNSTIGDEVHLELSSDDYMAAISAAGLDETWKESTASYKDIGLLTTRKTDEKPQEHNPCSGSAYIIDTNVLKKWHVYFRFSSLVTTS